MMASLQTSSVGKIGTSFFASSGYNHPLEEYVDYSEFDRIREAYIAMAKEGRYRPFVPGDGLGSIDLTSEELADDQRLDKEASQYARDFIKKEDSMNFDIGTSNFRTNRALVYVIEAAKCLCGGQDEVSLRLLKMATAEIKANLGDSQKR